MGGSFPSLHPPLRSEQVVQSLGFEILGFFSNMMESSAGVGWGGFALRQRLASWMYFHISCQSALAPGCYFSPLSLPALSQGPCRDDVPALLTQTT